LDCGGRARDGGPTLAAAVQKVLPTQGRASWAEHTGSTRSVCLTKPPWERGRLARPGAAKGRCSGLRPRLRTGRPRSQAGFVIDVFAAKAGWIPARASLGRNDGRGSPCESLPRKNVTPADCMPGREPGFSLRLAGFPRSRESRTSDRANWSLLAAVQPSLRRDPPFEYIVQRVRIGLVGLFHLQRACQVGEFLQNGILSNLAGGLFEDLSVVQI